MNFLNQSLWLDEATTALVSKMPIGDILTKFLPGDFHPPAYYFLMHFWVSLFGDSEISLRAPSCIFAILTVYIVYKMAGKIPAMLLATSGLFIYYAGEARMYMMAAFLVSLAIYEFIKKRWIIFSIALVLIGLTDYVSLFILPIFLFLDNKNWRKVIASYIPLGISYVMWAPVLVKQLTYGFGVSNSNWGRVLGGTSLKNILLIPTKFLIGRTSFDNKLIYAVAVSAMVLLVGYLLIKAKKVKKVYWAWLVVPILLGIVVSFKIPMLAYFRYLFCLPALFIIISRAKVSKGFVWMILGLNIFWSVYYLANPRFYREDWRSAAKIIGQNKIVFPSNSQKEAMIYYGEEDQIVGAQDLKSTDKTIWLSRYVWELFDPGDTTRVLIEKLGYNKSAEYNFNGVVFWKYLKL